jgi:hypothetical protein
MFLAPKNLGAHVSHRSDEVLKVKFSIVSSGTLCQSRKVFGDRWFSPCTSGFLGRTRISKHVTLSDPYYLSYIHISNK